MKIHVFNGWRRQFYIFDSALKQKNIYEIERFKISYTICVFFPFNCKCYLNVTFFTLTVFTAGSFRKTDNLIKKILYFRDIKRKEYPPCYRRFFLKTPLIKLLTWNICLLSSSEWLGLHLFNCVMMNWDIGIVSYYKVSRSSWPSVK